MSVSSSGFSCFLLGSKNTATGIGFDSFSQLYGLIAGRDMQINLIYHFGIFIGGCNDYYLFRNAHFTHQSNKSVTGNVCMYKFVLLFLYSGLFTSTLFCVGDFFIEPCILTYFLCGHLFF